MTVRSWDTVQKKAIESKATAFPGRKDAKVTPAFDDPKLLLTRSSFGSPAEATSAAKAAMDRANEHNLQADGRCWGNAKLAVDKQVAIKGVNKRFDGKYRISHLRHRFSHDQGFTTEFSCRGVSDQSLSGLVSETAAGIAGAGGSTPDRNVFNGAVVGIVTDVKDPKELGRVKVKFPWLDEKQTSDWLRIAFPGGGGKVHSGWYLLPEVEDEVLVIFEHGDVRRGYVLGGLHNGVDKPFYKNDKVIGGDGKVNQHAFRLKNGAHLLFDEKAGEELVEIKNKDGKFVFKHSAKDGRRAREQDDRQQDRHHQQGPHDDRLRERRHLDRGQGRRHQAQGRDGRHRSTPRARSGSRPRRTRRSRASTSRSRRQASAEVKGNATAKLEAHRSDDRQGRHGHDQLITAE